MPQHEKCIHRDSHVRCKQHLAAVVSSESKLDGNYHDKMLARILRASGRVALHGTSQSTF